MAGRLRTASMPPSTLMESAVYSPLPFAALPLVLPLGCNFPFFFSDFASAAAAVAFTFSLVAIDLRKAFGHSVYQFFSRFFPHAEQPIDGKTDRPLATNQARGRALVGHLEIHVKLLNLFALSRQRASFNFTTEGVKFGGGRRA